MSYQTEEAEELVNTETKNRIIKKMRRPVG